MESFTTTEASTSASLLTTPVKRRSLVGPTVTTPDRVHNRMKTRIRNQNRALSISDIRRTKIQLRKPDPAAQLIKRVGSSLAKTKGSVTSPTLLLPRKYEVLSEFFDAMVSSIRLLRLKRLPATLTKLSRNIESLTDRRFTLHHLKQLKHTVPESIDVKKIRVQDEETGCMKEDLLVSLDLNAVETGKIAKGNGGYSHLKRIFQSRIIDQSDDDVPEAELPELFYKPKHEGETSVNQSSVVLPATTTLTGPTFKRRFSCKAAAVVDIESTPRKLGSAPVGLMSATPALRTPKRSRVTDECGSDLPVKSAKRRALKFDENSYDGDEEQQLCQNGNDVTVRNSDNASMDLMTVLPANLLHSLMEKEQRILEEQDPIVSQTRKRQQLMAGVPKLFDMIQLIFQSVRRTVMTKDELIHKLITGHLDIIDKGEVVEQLRLLQEVAPEFITELPCFSADTLLRINKSSCAKSVRAKLQEAI